jgi:hypothetical protein
MAEKRMFSMKVVDSDEFLELPASAQNLYFHLSMRADDDGFVGNPRTVARIIGAAEEDLQALTDSGFILTFGGRVVAIRHWRIHNSLRREYYIPTRYLMQLETLSVLPDGSYTERPVDGGTK